MDIKIEYNGEYPNLCSGQLILIIDGFRWIFPEYCLSSGGSVSFDEEWNEEITCGEWTIIEWPEDFPENLKSRAEEAVNSLIPHGCCGGCV